MTTQRRKSLFYRKQALFVVSFRGLEEKEINPL